MTETTLRGETGPGRPPQIEYILRQTEAGWRLRIRCDWEGSVVGPGELEEIHRALSSVVDVLAKEGEVR